MYTENTPGAAILQYQITVQGVIYSSCSHLRIACSAELDFNALRCSCTAFLFNFALMRWARVIYAKRNFSAICNSTGPWPLISVAESGLCQPPATPELIVGVALVKSFIKTFLV